MPRRSAASAQGPSIQPSISFSPPTRWRNSAAACTRSCIRPPPSGSGTFSRASTLLSANSDVGLVHRRRLVVEVVDRGPAVGGLAGRIGNARDVVEIELLGRANLPFHQHPIVRGVFSVGHADLVGGEHHGDRHQRQRVDGRAVESGENAVVTGHLQGLLVLPMVASETTLAP